MFDWDAVPTDVRCAVLRRCTAAQRLSMWMAAHADWAPLLRGNVSTATTACHVARLWRGREGDPWVEGRLREAVAARNKALGGGGEAEAAEAAEASEATLTQAAAFLGHTRYAGLSAPAAAADDRALLHALAGDQLQVARGLLARGAPVDAQRAAMASVRTDAAGTLGYLLACNVRPRLDAPLCQAIARGKALRCADLLFDHSPPLARMEGAWLAMMREAARRQDADALRALSARRGLVGDEGPEWACDYEGLLATCLAPTGSCARILACMQAILAAAGRRHAPHAASAAAFAGRVDVLAALLRWQEAVAEDGLYGPMAADDYASLAQVAAEQGHASVVTYLLQHKWRQPTAFHRCYYFAAAAGQWPVVEALLALGVPLAGDVYPTMTPACGAAAAGSVAWLQRFIDGGATVTPQAVRAAAKADHVAAVAFMAGLFESNKACALGHLVWANVVRQAVVPAEAAEVLEWLLRTGRWTPPDV